VKPNELFEEVDFNLYSEEIDDPAILLQKELDKREGRIIEAKRQMILLPEKNHHDD